METGIATESYRDFSARVHDGLIRSRIPTGVSIEVTHRCPLSCVHCYDNLPASDPAARGSELTKDEHVRILDELVEAGTLWLLYTGGEIFLRPDFLDIFLAAKKRGFIVTLFTNGTLITPRVADFLADWRPFTVEISLYGATARTYEAVTGVKGSYERCLRGVRLLHERGIPIALKGVALRSNVHELEAMKRLARDEFGLGFKFDAMMSPRLDCSQAPLASRLDPADAVALDFADTARRRSWVDFVGNRGLAPARATDTGAAPLYLCGGGVGGFAIDPAGMMRLCSQSQRDAWDLKRGSLADGWVFISQEVRSRCATRPTKCTNCRLTAICGMCPANGELENGDPEAPVDFLCHVGHLRAQVFGWPIPVHGECEYCEGGALHPAVRSEAEKIREMRGGEVIVPSSPPGAAGIALPSLPPGGAFPLACLPPPSDSTGKTSGAARIRLDSAERE